MATIFDLIDNFWGNDPLRKIQRADKFSFERFAREVNRFYESYTVPELDPGKLRTYYGGSVAVNFSLSGKGKTFFNNLLYSHSTIVPDPIARWYFDRYEELSKTPPAIYSNGLMSADQSEWIGWMLNSHRAFRWNLEASREVLHYFVAQLLPLRPLVEKKIIVIVSQAHVMLQQSRMVVAASLQDADDDAFRACVLNPIDEKPPLWDNIRGGVMTGSAGGITPEKAIAEWATAKEAAYHIHKNLEIADIGGGLYIPENKTDAALLEAIVRRSAANLGYELETAVARQVRELNAPSLEQVPISDLISIRKDEESFEEFRLWLNSRLLGLDPTFSVVLTSAEIESEVTKLRQNLSASAIIKKSLKDDGLKIVVQTMAGMAAGSSVAQPVLGAAAGALAGILKRFVTARNETGVFAKIARMNRVAPDAGDPGDLSDLPRALRMPFLGELINGPRTGETRYTTARLREIVGKALMPNTTGNPYKAIPG